MRLTPPAATVRLVRKTHEFHKASSRHRNNNMEGKGQGDICYLNTYMKRYKFLDKLINDCKMW